MFEELGDRLDKAIGKIKGYGTISEDNIADVLREVRLALLEADVNYKVVKEFTNKVKEKALGEEVKKSLKASHRPNQDYYIQLMNKMSFARFISPEIKEEVLDELCKALQPKRSTRSSRCK